MSRSERIRHAREYCGLTQTALGELAGIPQGRVSDIEAGRITVRDDEVSRIATATSFPRTFFDLGPLPAVPDGNFRKLKRGTAKASSQVRAQARQIVELVERAEKVLRLPPLVIEPVRDVNGAEDIEAAASALREAAGIGEHDRVPHVTRALERAGIVVAALPVTLDDHDGFSVWADFALDGRPVVVYAAGAPGDRQRFTLAHEAGHLILHSQLRRTPVDAAQAEREANRFAGAFLLPETVAVDALRPPLTLQTLLEIKGAYGISIGAGAQRARDLGLIDQDRFISIRKQLSSRGWHRNEPGRVETERPLLIRKVIEMTAAGDTIARQAESVHFPLFAFRALAGAA